MAKFWGGRRGSNPQQPEPQSGALPLSYGHRLGEDSKGTSSSEPAKQIFGGWRTIAAGVLKGSDGRNAQ
jgi:hypothetical protein